MAALMERVFVAVPNVAKHAGSSYPTAKSAIDALVGAGVLVPHGRVSGRQVWRAEELLREVYEG